MTSEASDNEIVVRGRGEWKAPGAESGTNEAAETTRAQSGGLGGAPRNDAVGTECYDILFIEGSDRNWVSSCNLSSIAGTKNTPWWERLEPGEPGEADEGEAAAPPGQPVIVTAQELQSLIVDSGGLTVQPQRPWVLVNMETIALTGASEQLLGTVVLGVPVRVRAIPVEFTWDFGDGSAPLVGTDPGAAWPNHTVSHVYTRPGVVDVSVTTQWDGYFQPEGGTAWVPVAGRAVTTETSDPIEVVTAVPRLVTGN